MFLQVKFIENLKLSYGEQTGTFGTPSFDICLRIAKFRFDDESTERLLDIIKHFESSKINQSDPGSLLYLGFKPIMKTFPYAIRYYFVIDVSNVILISDDFTVEVNEIYFYIKLRQMIEDMFLYPEDFERIDNHPTYIRLLTICKESPKMFRHFYRTTAKKMIQWNYPENIQTFLTNLLFDIRIEKTTYAQFNDMYDQDLYFYVKMICEILYGQNDSEDDIGENRVVCDVLTGLRSRDFERFVILVTHFTHFRHLLDHSGHSFN